MKVYWLRKRRSGRGGGGEEWTRGLVQVGGCELFVRVREGLHGEGERQCMGEGEGRGGARLIGWEGREFTVW